MMNLKTFEEFLNEENSVQGMDSITKPIGQYRRHELPNIIDKDKFINDIYSKDKYIISKIVNPNDLTPSQKEFNDEKINDMVLSKTYNESPIIITSDDIIIDGHHRWKASVKDNSNIKCHQLSSNFNDMLTFLNNKDYTINKKINEKN